MPQCPFALSPSFPLTSLPFSPPFSPFPRLPSSPLRLPRPPLASPTRSSRHGGIGGRSGQPFHSLPSPVSPSPAPLYDSHVPLSPIQRAAVAIGSFCGSAGQPCPGLHTTPSSLYCPCPHRSPASLQPPYTTRTYHSRRSNEQQWQWMRQWELWPTLHRPLNTLFFLALPLSLPSPPV
ncbi:unnamed protein product [Closterium sp. NIES-54]